MNPALTLAIYALAATRVTTFITADKLTTPLRTWWTRRFCGNPDPTQDCRSIWTYLIHCPWCVSIYVAAPTAIVWWLWPSSPWTLGPAVALAVSQIAGMLADVGR